MSIFDDIDGLGAEQGDRARVLLHGVAGTGKTSAAGSMAAAGPTLFMYVPGEEGINSLKGIEGEENIKLLRLKSTASLLDEIYPALVKGEGGFSSVVLDSVSALQTMKSKELLGLKWDSVVKKPPAKDYGFWGELRDWFTDFSTLFYGLSSTDNVQPVNVIMTAQTKEAGQDGVETDRMLPDLFKGPMAPMLSRPDYIFFTTMESYLPDGAFEEKYRHVMRIKPSPSVMAKLRSSPDLYDKLPDVVGRKGRVTLPKVLEKLGVNI